MADRIVACAVTKDVDENPVQYDVSYEVEHNDKTNSFCVTIPAEELTDATDTAEVKTKANVKAKAIKDAWIDSIKVETSAAISIDGDVSL